MNGSYITIVNNNRISFVIGSYTGHEQLVASYTGSYTGSRGISPVSGSYVSL